MLSILLTAAILPTLVLADSVVTIFNSCSSTIKPQLIGTNNGVANPAPLAPGARTQVTLNGGFYGKIYANTGGENDGQTGATKALLSLSNGYYYVLLDSGFNEGISITPQSQQQHGLCSPASCTSSNCADAAHKEITFPRAPSAPKPPVHSCPGHNVPFLITFCPGNTPPPPPSTSVQIHPNGNKAKCLDVRAATYANGTPVQVYDCNGTGAQKWVIHKDNTKVQVAGTNFCLDAGTTPGNNVGMKIWTCFDNLPAQAFFYTGDNRIAVTGKGQCLDLTNGNLANGNQVQTYHCTAGNTNQIWTTTS